MLHINKHQVCLIENQKLGTNIKLIKSYIQCTLSNTVIRTNKANVFFLLFFRVTKHSKCEKKIFSHYWIIQLLDIAFADRHFNEIIIF